MELIGVKKPEVPKYEIKPGDVVKLKWESGCVNDTYYMLVKQYNGRLADSHILLALDGKGRCTACGDKTLDQIRDWLDSSLIEVLEVYPRADFALQLVQK